MRKRITFLIIMMFLISLLPITNMRIFASDDVNQPQILLLQAKAVGNKAVELRWTKQDNDTRYKIFGKVEGKKNYKLYKNVIGKNTVTIKNLKPHKIYSFLIYGTDYNKVSIITGNTKGKYGNVRLIRFKESNIGLGIGESAQVHIELKTYKGKKHIKKSYGEQWRFFSSLPDVVKIDSNGIVTRIGEKIGPVIIYVQDISGNFARMIVN